MEGKQGEQEDLMREQRSLLRGISKKNAEVGAAAEGITKSYSQTGMIKGVWKAGKEAFSGGVKSNILMGIGATGAGYGISKFIQKDMKKNNMSIDAETGQLQQNSYSDVPPATTSISNNTKKPGIFRRALGPAGSMALGGVFESGELFGYMADKQQAKQMANMTQQRAYGVVNSTLQAIKNPVKWYKGTTMGADGMKSFKSTMSGWFNNIASMGVGGKENVGKFAKGLKNSGNETLSKVGNWMIENPNSANMATAVPLMGVGTLAWTSTQKGTEKAVRAMDSKAYAYRDAKNKQI